MRLLLVFAIYIACCNAGFLNSPRTNHSVWVQSFGENEMHLAQNASNVFVFTGSDAAILNICNFNNGCDGRLSGHKTCIAVTPECNCLQWIGQLNRTESSSSAISLDSAYESQCIRVWCNTSCTIRIDWYLANVNMSVPQGLSSLAYHSYVNSGHEQNIDFGVYFYTFFYQQICNPFGFSAGCPSSTILSITPVNIGSDNANKGVTIVAIIVFGVIVFMSVASMFHLTRQATV
jgi:hypothetical protein